MLDNCTEWIKTITRRYSSKSFNETEDTRLFALFSKEVWTIFPPAIKTSIPKVDSTQDKSAFTRYSRDTPEVYDLPRLLKTVPSTDTGGPAEQHENILASILVSIMSVNEEALLLKLISLLFKMYSQRLLLVEALKETFPISSETNLAIYSEVLAYNKFIYKMIDRIDHWSRNEDLIAEASDMVKILDVMMEKLEQKDTLVTPTPHRQTEHKSQEIFYQAGCHIMIIKIYKKLILNFNMMIFNY